MCVRVSLPQAPLNKLFLKLGWVLMVETRAAATTVNLRHSSSSSSSENHNAARKNFLESLIKSSLSPLPAAPSAKIGAVEAGEKK